MHKPRQREKPPTGDSTPILTIIVGGILGCMIGEGVWIRQVHWLPAHHPLGFRRQFDRQVEISPARLSGHHLKHIILLLVLTSVLAAGCARATRSIALRPTNTPIGQSVAVVGGSYTDITPGELNAMLKEKVFTFVNVHIPFEGNIAQTDVSIPYDEIDRYLGVLPADKEALVVLYCRSGRMSAEAAQTLVRLGYTNVWNLDGGMIAWEQAGYLLEK